MRRFWTETIKGLPVVGHVISANGVSTDPDKTRAVEQLPIPSNVSNVRHILVCTTVGWTLQRLPPLHCLTAKSIERFQWSSECNRPFCTLKDKLVIAPVLAFPQWCKVHCGWRCEWSHMLVMCWTIVSTWPPIQHYQERDACYGLCNHTLPSLPVWKTVCCQRRPQHTWVDPELSRTQGTSCQLAWVIGPVRLQDWTPTRIEHQKADALLRNPLAVAEDTDQCNRQQHQYMGIEDCTGHHESPTNHRIWSEVHPGCWRQFHEMDRGIPAPESTGKDSHRKAGDKVISRFREPEHIHTDQGGNFTLLLGWETFVS